MRARPALLNLAHLSVQRGKTPLLHDFSWRVDRGQHWAILGPNGCGKTTLIKALTGYITVSAGEIEVLGLRYGHTDWRELRLFVGVVTSALQSGVPPAETALETVMSGRFGQIDLWAHTTAADRKAARRLLTFVDALPLVDRAWVHLSQGERQRVLIARALMTRPRLLILDEPCAGLDPVAREHFLSFIERLARQPRGPTLILITHHVEEITPAFSHALLMRGGKIATSGPRKKVLTSAALTDTFGTNLKLVTRSGRLSLVWPARRRPTRSSAV